MREKSDRSLGRSRAKQAPPLGQFYEVGGRLLLLHQSGSGGPAVVFLPGAGAVGLDYLLIQRRVAELTTTLLYDRAGTGWSDRTKLPRTAVQVTDELRDMLRLAGVPPPYLLVGHSLGGLYARHYAQRFPEEVAALLLLDPAHEDFDAYMPQQLNEMRKAGDPDQQRSGKLIGSPVAFVKRQLGRLVNVVLDGAVRSALGRGLLLLLPAVRRYPELYRGLFAREMTDWPEEIRETLIERHTSLEWLVTGIQEVRNVDQLYDEVRHAGPSPDIPLIVLCSMGVDDFRRAVSVGVPESLLREELEGKRRLYTVLAASVPRGEMRPVDGGHFTMVFRPDAAFHAVQDLLGK